EHPLLDGGGESLLALGVEGAVYDLRLGIVLVLFGVTPLPADQLIEPIDNQAMFVLVFLACESRRSTASKSYGGWVTLQGVIGTIQTRPPGTPIGRQWQGTKRGLRLFDLSPLDERLSCLDFWIHLGSLRKHGFLVLHGSLDRYGFLCCSSPF